jgi:O-methyltransferase involved in polyketide biosynthesis
MALDEAGFDPSVAHPARIYNYWLGGTDNFEADRVAGEETIAAYPGIRMSARANRAFLARAVRHLTGEGVRQFLDIGTGLPTANNTHEIAQSIAPDSKIVYVDNDPLVLAHARTLLHGTPEGTTAYLQADLRNPDAILAEAARTIDFSQPVGIMLLAVVHFLSDADDPRSVIARLTAAVPPGSFLVLSHAASDLSPEQAANMIDKFNARTPERATLRTHDEVTGLFDGLEILSPGVVRVTYWRPDSDLEASSPTTLWAGVARKTKPAHQARPR